MYCLMAPATPEASQLCSRMYAGHCVKILVAMPIIEINVLCYL